VTGPARRHPTEKVASDDGDEPDDPIVVPVDRGSAATAEMVAAALAASGRSAAGSF